MPAPTRFGKPADPVDGDVFTTLGEYKTKVPEPKVLNRQIRVRKGRLSLYKTPAALNYRELEFSMELALVIIVLFVIGVSLPAQHNIPHIR